jgi:hypothetical protein
MEKLDTKVKLSTLWLFALLNYLYCDLIGLMDSNLLKQFLTGTVGGIEFTQGFLLGASILMEIPIAMILFSRILNYKTNKWTNIIAGTLMTIVQIATLLFGTSTIYYIFFSIIEIIATGSIVWIAWKWKNS